MGWTWHRPQWKQEQLPSSCHRSERDHWVWDRLQDAGEGHLGIEPDLTQHGLGKESKSGKGRDLTGLGKNEYGKIEVKEDLVASLI